MPNTAAPFGFRPIRRQDGAAWSSQFAQLKAQNTAGALNRGDVVKSLGDGTVAAAAPADGHVVRGLYQGCHYLLLALGYNIWSNYWPGSGALGLVDVFVMDDPFVVMEAQAAAGPIVFADIGANADVVVNASTTGFSKWALGAPTTTASAAFPFKIIGLGNNGYYISDGYDTTAANNIVEVTWNEMFMKTAALGI
jgi:hypothetical protein